MNELQVFSNPDFGDIRTLIIDDEPWWVGRDISDKLGYKNGSRDINRHVDLEDKMTYQNGTPPITDNMGRPQKAILINESGLYSLILSSKLPSAKKFKRWITSEVLPALRKTGKYEIQKPEPVEQRQLTVDDYIRAAHIIAGCRNERMPIVLALIEKSGIVIPKIEEIEDKTQATSVYEETGETASLINEAINEYDMTQARIAKLCGIHPTQIMRIRSGQSKPKKDRARVIQDAIRREMKKMNKNA